MIVLQPQLLYEGWGGHLLCLSGDSPVLTDPIGLVIVQLRAVFCPLVQYLSSSCETFSWVILDSSRLPLLHSGQAFHKFKCPLPVVFPQIFFNLTILLSSFLCLLHAPLNVVAHYLVFLRSFTSNLFFLNSLLLSHRSRIAAVTQGFFLLATFAKISLAVSVTAELKVWSLNSCLHLHYS